MILFELINKITNFVQRRLKIKLNHILKMKIINLFIAGAKALTKERECLKVLVNDFNAEQSRLGIEMFINACSYENFGDRQLEYDKFIEESDLFFLLVDNQLGSRSMAELDIAVKAFCSNNKTKPLIHIFVKQYDNKSQDVLLLEDKLKQYDDGNQYDYYYVDYQDIATLGRKANSRLQFFIKQQILGMATQQPKSQQSGDVKAIFKSLALSLSELFVANAKVYCQFPYIEQSRIVEMLSEPCSGDYANVVAAFTEKFSAFIESIEAVRDNDEARRLFCDRLEIVTLKTKSVAPKSYFDVTNLTDVISLMKLALEELKNGTMRALITARLACNTKFDRYDNANMRMFSFMGFLCMKPDLQRDLLNLGAKTIHDIYYALPEEYKEFVHSDLEKALVDAEYVPDFYRLGLDK